MSGKESSSSSSSSSSLRMCLCSPTAHPGSFRCSLHRGGRKSTQASMSRMLEAKMVITKVNLLKAFLMQIINPSSHDARRRKNFQPRPTRFSVMNGLGDGVAVS